MSHKCSTCGTKFNNVCGAKCSRSTCPGKSQDTRQELQQDVEDRTQLIADAMASGDPVTGGE